MVVAHKSSLTETLVFRGNVPKWLLNDCHNAQVLVILTSTLFIFWRPTTFKQFILCAQSTHIQGGRRRPPSQIYPDIKPTSITQNLRTFYFVFSACCLVEGVFKYRPASSVKYSSSHTLSLPGSEKHSGVFRVLCLSTSDRSDRLSYSQLLGASLS